MDRKNFSLLSKKATYQHTHTEDKDCKKGLSENKFYLLPGIKKYSNSLAWKGNGFAMQTEH